jgi:hypothetical protein
MVSYAIYRFAGENQNAQSITIIKFTLFLTPPSGMLEQETATWPAMMPQLGKIG